MSEPLGTAGTEAGMPLGAPLPAPVQQRFDRPAHAGVFPADTHGVIEGRAGNPALGTQVWFQWRVADGAVAEARFRAFGCPYTLAVCDFIAAGLNGGQPPQPWQGDPHSWAAALSVPPERLGRLLIIEDALRDAFRGWPGSGVK
ncbi:MAG TPA: iron-sulfur cluster assembly scaffold protein [Steroidobacteraceae bacterium]